MAMQTELDRLYTTRVTRSHPMYSTLLKEHLSTRSPPVTLAEVLQRSDFAYSDLQAAGFGHPDDLPFQAKESCEISVKYAQLLEQ